MKHLLDINQLSRETIELLIERALHWKQHADYPSYPNKTVALLFYESSTRTRVSFELAAKHLSMSVIRLDIGQSSENKGELIADTVQNLEAMGIDCFVIRHAQQGMPGRLADCLKEQAQIINAGDGAGAHPSQALLDLMTIVSKKPRLEGLKIAILGNIKHSRVAHSLETACRIMQVGELVLVAPEPWRPQTVEYGRLTGDLKEGLSDADVVICLRVQQERLLESEKIDLAWYQNHYGLTQSRLAYAKPNAMVMHPGPMNRGIEIDSNVADGSQSLILEQVKNGVYMRMAIFDALFRV